MWSIFKLVNKTSNDNVCFVSMFITERGKRDSPHLNYHGITWDAQVTFFLVILLKPNV